VFVLVVKSFIELVKHIFTIPGVQCFLSERKLIETAYFPSHNFEQTQRSAANKAKYNSQSVEYLNLDHKTICLE